MVDNVSKEIRTKTMRAVRSSSTSLELQFMKSLWARGFRFRRNVSSLLGKPDIAIKKHKIVIFLDSCFWHGCKKHCRMPSSNVDYWNKKIARNKERDKQVNRYYRSQGWSILRIWEHSLKKDFEACLIKTAGFIDEKKKS